MWRQLSEVFNPTPAAGEQWLSLVGFTGGAQLRLSLSGQGGVLGRERKALGLGAEAELRTHCSRENG